MGFFGAGDGGVEEDGVEAELHGEGGVGGGAEAGVDDERDFGDELAHHAEVVACWRCRGRCRWARRGA